MFSIFPAVLFPAIFFLHDTVAAPSEVVPSPNGVRLPGAPGSAVPLPPTEQESADQTHISSENANTQTSTNTDSQSVEVIEVGVPSGWIPLSQFNGTDGGDSGTLVEIIQNRIYFEPVEISDEELLAGQPPPLSPYASSPSDVMIYCYPFGNEEVNGKCREAVDTLNATGVYLPMMMELQLEKEAAYYDEIAKFKNAKRKDGGGYRIIGISYDNPNWHLIEQIVKKHKYFDGVLLEWIGNDACMWNINQPDKGALRGIYENSGMIYYFFRHQNCDDGLLRQNGFNGAYINENPKGFNLEEVEVVRGKTPSFVVPIFACFQGEEGACYKALRFYHEDACNDDRQLYAFSPYEPNGNLMMHFANQTCHGLPNHALYSVV